MEISNPAPVDVENPQTPIATSIKKEFDTLSPLSSECCIYRVPERLRHVNERAYTPKVVSIGPLHHGKHWLKAMEEHKMRYLRDYIQRTEVKLEDYIKVVKDNEAKLRGCYAETIGFHHKDEFAKIILVDSAFIIMFLLRYSNNELIKEDDRIFEKPWMVNDIWPDLLLLENQLPFFILEVLFSYPNKVEYPSNNTSLILDETHWKEDFSIFTLSYKFLKKTMHLEGTEGNLMQMSSTTIQHFVDFLRNLFVPVAELNQAGVKFKERPSKHFVDFLRNLFVLVCPRKEEKCESLTTPSIAELNQAGVKFKVREQSKNLLDIHFGNGILEIPRLKISDHTEQNIRNLVAFEQCHCTQNYLSDYVAIMDRLVSTPKDVQLLVNYEIVENLLGDYRQVSTLINKLGDGVSVGSNFYFANTSKDLNDYCKQSWNKWKASLKQKYFNTPWAALSVIAAVVIILLTIIQAVCSIISVS